jgi:hypothetical protein
MLMFGVIGCVSRKLDYPIAPKIDCLEVKFYRGA